MKFYEELKKTLSHFNHVLIKDKYEDYIIFSSFKDHKGGFRASPWNRSIKNCKKSIGRTDGYPENQINTLAEPDNWEIVDAWNDPFKRFEIGEKVVIKKTGEIGKILDQRSDMYYGLMSDKGYVYSLLFYHSELMPYFEESDDLESNEILINGKKYKITEIKND